MSKYGNFRQVNLSTIKRETEDDGEVQVLSTKRVCYDDTNHNIKNVIADKKRKHNLIHVSSSTSVASSSTSSKLLERAAQKSSINGNGTERVSNLSHSADPLLLRILGWDVNWLDKYHGKQNFPPISARPWRALKLAYTSFDEYTESYAPLIMNEIWALATEKWELGQHQVMHVSLGSYELSNKYFLRLDCQRLISEETYKESNYNDIEGELCVCELQTKTSDGNKMIRVFAYVSHVEISAVNKGITKSLIHSTLKISPEQKYLIRYQIHVKLRQVRLDVSKLMRVTTVFYMKPILRNIEALYSLKNSRLCADILKPREITCQMAVPSCIQPNIEGYNKSQMRAIIAAAEAVQRPYNVPKLLLIQGPPGTGKTRTLIGMIEKIFTDWTDIESSPKILVCAPSNGAIDVIAERLYAARKFLKKTRFKRHLRLVRVGQSSLIASEVKKISLDEIVEKNHDNRLNDLAVQEKNIRELEEAIAKKDEQITLARQKHRTDVADHLSNELFNLYQDLELLQQSTNQLQMSNRSESAKKTLRTDVLRKADVILTTLNSSRQSVLETNYHTDRDAVQFSCVIIDEASQCSEPEVLMPLTYSSISKMILIGDPMQLPATVLSNQSIEFEYGRSLFERIFLYFGRFSKKSPVIMLNTQHRMHPEICSFPSKQFYDGYLVSSECVKNRQFPLKSYMLIDLRNSQHTISVNDLCPNNTTVGVITPYQGQKKLLQKKLRHLQLPIKVDVNTIDGFQGQERDVIILSCVRSFGSGNDVIGFLDSAQRLNVALTRAKHSMIVCLSNFSSIDSEMWQNLLEDAENRNVKYEKNYDDCDDLFELLAADS